jgi:hypothetical protein
MTKYCALFVGLAMIASPATAQTQTPQIAQQIADAAPNYGISPSLALKTAKMESDMGRDLGSLGNIFQLNRTNWRDMGGGDMSDVNLQIARGLKYLAHDQQIATQALGRPPEDWETYMVHQQGDAGGPALMKATPGAKAVDVVAAFYNNRATAERAIIANLTAQDFVALQTRRFEQKPYEEPVVAAPAAAAPKPPSNPFLSPARTMPEMVFNTRR